MDLEKLVKFQEKLARSIVLEDKIDFKKIRYVVGVDQAFVDDKIISACVKLSYPSLEVVDSNVVVEKAKFPYIPTFLMFREGMPAVRALKKLIDEKDNTVIIVDGSGIAHPRKCGLATFISLKLRIPTIGITKKRLYGFVEKPKKEMEAKPIYDEKAIIGYSLKSCKRCNPIFISPGSYITPKTALKVVMNCIRKHKLPEPIRLAHNLANKTKNEWSENYGSTRSV
ncbi:endonuclease V [Archaeoglobales archaeon]|nr:MAG: endonuclease V [Archaeoglobales archaeon]